MANILFKINEYLLLEYVKNTDVISSNDAGFRLINNNYDSSKIVVNSSPGDSITFNKIDNSVVKLGDGRYALMDNDTSFFYPLIDNNITVNDINIQNSLIDYDTIRIHVLSGYNFDDLVGGIFRCGFKTMDDNNVMLFSVFLNSNITNNLFFNPKPKILSDLVYDKYYEIKIPNHQYLLQQQQNYGIGNQNYLHGNIAPGGIKNENILYFAYSDVVDMSQDNSSIYYTISQEVIFTFKSENLFSQLTANIVEQSDGDYFLLYGNYGSQSMEDLIYSLNSIAGNNYMLIHNISIYEQIGNSFISPYDSLTITQTKDFDKPIYFRPLLLHQDRAVGFSIDYTINLYNRVDGRNIFTEASYFSNDGKKYGKTSVKLNIGNNNNLVKVYNKINSPKNINITDNLQKIVNNKTVFQFVDKKDVVVYSNSDATDDGVTNIEITPFDDVILFNVGFKSGDKVLPMELDTTSKYKLVFTKDDGSKLKISELITDQSNKDIGQISFKISKKDSEVISNIKSNNDYKVIVDNSSTESLLFSGKFKYVK